MPNAKQFRAARKYGYRSGLELKVSEFVKEFEAKNGADAYIAISVKDYENLSLNFAELRRYIEQQKQIIVYYENAVKPEEKPAKSE